MTATVTPRTALVNEIPFSNAYLEQASLINPHRMTDNNNYNFNINMNLYLNQMPMTPMPSFLGGSPYNPYLDLQYQSILYNQMNHQIPMIPSFYQYPQQPPPPPYQPDQIRQRQITYIVIDE